MTLFFCYQNRGRRLLSGAALALSLGVVALSPRQSLADPFEFTFQQLAPGVWAGVRADCYEMPVMGSTTFVISDEGVVVFDGGGVPKMAELTIAKIRTLTGAPVTHLIISHWHGDHNLGIHRFLEEYPGAQVIGHAFTRAAMTGPRMDYARKKDRVAGYITQFQTALDSGVDLNGDPLVDFTREWLERFLRDADLVDREYRRSEITPPTITFRDSLVIHSGGRRIEALFLGEANTAGDIVLWLPQEKIVAAGDMVVYPTPYGFSVPPRPWAAALKRLKALNFEILVPGHGDIQYDSRYLDLLIETAESIADQRDNMIADGLDTAQVKERLDFSHFEERFTRGDPIRAYRFRTWFTEPFRAAAIKALTGEPMVDPE
ncbi:MAG TPA: MBL fold metallo-hydrolase [candidate division Zixibacteria bacterium]|nr:MBL fold metallo-hydrolase [candidate division Zixibacteria bacterium]